MRIPPYRQQVWYMLFSSSQCPPFPTVHVPHYIVSLVAVDIWVCDLCPNSTLYLMYWLYKSDVLLSETFLFPSIFICRITEHSANSTSVITDSKVSGYEWRVYVEQREKELEFGVWLHTLKSLQPWTICIPFLPPLALVSSPVKWEWPRSLLFSIAWDYIR